jgi:hypothetical protein
MQGTGAIPFLPRFKVGVLVDQDPCQLQIACNRSQVEGGSKVPLFIDLRAGRKQVFNCVHFAREHSVMELARLSRTLKQKRNQHTREEMERPFHHGALPSQDRQILCCEHKISTHHLIPIVRDYRTSFRKRPSAKFLP